MDTDTLNLLSLSPKAALVQLMANAAQPDLAVDQLTVLNVTAGVGTQTTVVVGLELVPEDLSTWNYAGETTLQYDRIDLSVLFAGIALTFIPDNYPTSVDWLCAQIASVGQIQFDPTDFIREPITKAMATTYYLKADPNSLRFIGQVPVTLFHPRLLSRFFVPVGQSTPLIDMGAILSIAKTYGIGMLSSNTNGTLFARALKALVVGYQFNLLPNAAVLKWNLFNRVLNVFPGLWVLDAAGVKPYNGYNSLVAYNGLIDPTIDKPYNVNLTHVCRIELDPNYCSNFDGTLSIYYSLVNVGNN
jgi:hypothetical protein